MTKFCYDPLWDTNLTWATNDPQFTNCFQQSVLSWIPCIFLLAFSSLEVKNIRDSRYWNIPWSLYNISKLVAFIILLTLSMIDLIVALTIFGSTNIAGVLILSPLIKAAAFITAASFIYYNKKFGIRSSGVQFIFSLLLVIFAIPQFKSTLNHHHSPDNSDLLIVKWEDHQCIVNLIYFPVVIFLFVLSCFADHPAQNSSFIETINPSPELNASFLNQILFTWIDYFIWQGFKKPLEDSEIYDILPEHTSSELVPRFERHWDKFVIKKSMKKSISIPEENEKIKPNNMSSREFTKTNGSIVVPMLKAFGAPFYFAGLVKLFTELLNFASPFLLQALITYTLNGGHLWKGISFALGFFIVALLQSILNGQYFQLTFLSGFQVRSALIGVIYKKVLKISNSAKKNSTVGEIVNLMAIDANRFIELAMFVHMLWSGPFTIIIALYFLWQILGLATLAGFVVMILLIPLNAFIAKHLRLIQVAQMKKKDERVKFMNEILNGIKVLKLYAWELSFQEMVQQVRSKEIKLLRKRVLFTAGIFFAWSMAPFLVAVTSFATFVLISEDNVLDANTAFVSLTLFNILRFPLTNFPYVISYILESWVSIKRINKFLNAEELDPEGVSFNKSDFSLTVENGTFSWGEETNVLKNINVKVMKKNLIALVGPVGCGKSSLVSAFLGEIEKREGKVNVDGTIAYVPQQAWIQNATLKDNILFGRSYDAARYKKVLEACALLEDIKMLPGGNETEIGEKGINLSGGQKQRISLARAVYADAEIYLLDDTLSAVDAHVGKHIFDNVIGPNGLLAKKTRFLVTHGISFLPTVNEIIVMKDGEITEQGSYKRLLEQKGIFAEFLIEYLQNTEEVDEEELEQIKKTLDDKSGRAILERAISHQSTVSNGSLRRRTSNRNESTNSLNKIPLISLKKNKVKIIEKEESAVGSVGIDVFVRYIRSIGWSFVIVSVCAHIMNHIFSVTTNVWLSVWANDKNSSISGQRDKYLAVYTSLGIGEAIAQFTATITFNYGALRAAKYIHNRLLSQTLKLPMSFFDTTPLGRIINRFSKDVDIVDNALPASINGLLAEIFRVVAIFGIISFSTPMFLTVIIPVFVVFFFIQRYYIATSRQLKRIESVTRSPIYSHFGETITGRSTIRAYNDVARFISESQDRVDYNQAVTYLFRCSNRWLAIRLEFLGSFIILFAALFAVFARESLTPAVVGLSLSYALQTTMIVNFLVRMTADTETNVVSVERIEEYADSKTEASWMLGEIDKSWPPTGKIEFEDYAARYRDGLDLVVKGISFVVEGGEKVGIVGRTGAGKSSLTLGLFRIIEAAGGKIIIDGKDISKLGLHALRSRLTIIPQDPVLFYGTLRMNIDPFGYYSDEEIWRALDLSHLKAYVKGLQMGLSHEITEGGENMSVGQRQLVCLARALLRKTKVLILDEATAAIDIETDELIQKTIRSEFAECTVLTIAHRLNTIIDSNKVIVLDQGKIAEFESPEILLKDESSIFYGMAKKAGLV